VPFVKGE